MKTLLTLFTFLFITGLQAQVMEPDSSFGRAGQVIKKVVQGSHGDDFIYSIIGLADGKVLAVGSTRLYDGNSVQEKSVIIRFSKAGFKDGRFKKVIMSIGNGFSEFKSAKLQSDNKIIAAGYANMQGMYNQLILARFEEIGYLDTHFGTNGIASLSIPAKNAYASDIVIGDDDKIYVAGYTLQSNSEILVAKFNANGKIDSSFNNKGWLIISAGESARANSIALDKDGKILITGYTKTGIIQNIFVARINPGGTTDNNFGENGISIFPFNNFAEGNSIALSNDKILIGGSMTPEANTNDFVVAQLDANGNTDNNFGVNGIVTTDFGFSDVARSIQVMFNGKILAAGYSYDNKSTFNSRFAIARYEQNGSPDLSFGTNGKMLTSFFGQPKNQAYAMAFQPFGRVLVAGYAGGKATGSADFAILRISPVRWHHYFNAEISNSNKNNSTALTVFPNPINNILQIKLEGFSQNVGVKLFSKTGRLFLEKKFQPLQGKQSSFTLNTSSIPNGIYTLYVSDEKGNYKSAEIIVQH